MDLDALTVRQLRYVVAAADAPTFTDAADGLAISQSALSQAMARLETLVGERLFSTAGRTRRLNRLGEVFVARARQVIGIAATLEQELAAHTEGSAGRLEVGMIDAVALYLAPDAVTTLKRSHPHAEVGVTVSSSGRLIAGVVEHELDVAVVVGPVDADLHVVPIVDEPLHIYHGSVSGAVTDAPWVLYPAGSHTRRAIDRGLASHGFAPEVIAESSNPAVLSRLAVMEGAVTVLPADVAGGAPALVDDGIIARREIVAVRRVDDASPLVAGFINELTKDG